MVELTDQRKARLLGALFHDIGKFQYRAEKTDVPHHKNSELFIRERFSRLYCVQSFLEQAVTIAGEHHSEYADRSIKTADGLSASERSKDLNYRAHRPLLSIFKRIDIGFGDAPKGSWFVKPGALNLIDIFPESLKDEPESWRPDVEEMRKWHSPVWEDFLKEFKKIPENISFDALYDTLYALMERWTCRVSSAGYGFTPDISLFDHSRVVAAYADCLAESDNPENPFLVIEGDVSGIQSFIYRLANPTEGDQKKSSKTLRGRSLYITLLSDSIADYILKKLGLFKVHLLMNGGGHFHILLPNTTENRNSVLDIEREINRWLIKEFRGGLGLVMASAEFSANVIKNYDHVKITMSRLLTQLKSRKNLSLFGEADVFGPHDPGIAKEYWDVCRVCGDDYMKNENGVCPNCRVHQNVGEILPKAKYLLKIHSGTYPKLEGETVLPMRGINVYWVIVKSSNDIDTLIAKCTDGVHFEINTINETEFLDARLSNVQKILTDVPVVLGFRLIGKAAPQKENKTLSFEELANDGENGYPLLHILRMDVDNLGQIFAFGLKSKPDITDSGYYSISRLSNLSREMNLFFSGYLNHLAEKNNIYITYSGGDDLFVVGKWNNVLKFAMAVRQDFSRFTCHNPNLSISGGAVLVKPSFPIRRGAELAGEEEAKAKSYQKNSKNALAVFNQIHSWDRVNDLINWADYMVDLIEGDKENKKYRNLIRYVKDLHDSFPLEERIANGDWIWRVKHKIHYMLARRANLTDHSMKQSEDKKVKVLGRLITDPLLLRDISTPATYALLQTRKPKN